jgi:glycosyltransferase involved in cell wall biosynthesis
MYNPIRSIIKQSVRKSNDSFNILTFSAHEAVETELARTNANFYALWSPGLKDWNKKYRPVPPNYKIIDVKGDIKNIPMDIDYDAILGHNKLAHGQQCKQIAQLLHLPWIQLEHCMPVLDQRTYEFYRNLKPDISVFITEHSRQAWGYTPEEARVIYHAIDHEVFAPRPVIRQRHLLSVANDFVNRGPLLGFAEWQFIVKDLPHRIIGATPGLSQAAPSAEALVNEYQTSDIFLNTSKISPIPHSLLESASCGCAIITTATCAIPEFFTHNVNCLMSNDPNELREYAVKLLNDPSECRRLGEAARQTILEKFHLNRYVQEWNELFESATKIPFKG